MYQDGEHASVSRHVDRPDHCVTQQRAPNTLVLVALVNRRSVERMRSLGFEIAEEAERCANLFGVKLPDGIDPEACRQHLARQQIHVAVRGHAVRVSPHVYNDEHDLERLADALSQLVPIHTDRQ